MCPQTPISENHAEPRSVVRSPRSNAANILVCVDGSDYTEPSLKHAVWLGDRVGAQRLIVTHIADVAKYQVPVVNELGAGIGLQPCNGLFSEIHKQEQDLLDELERRVKQVLQETPWRDRYDFVVGRGRPSEALNPSGVGYSHVVFGKRGDSFSYDQEHLGANLGRFLRHARTPCLLSSRRCEPIRKVACVLADDQEWRHVLDVFQGDLDPNGLQVHLMHTFEDEVPSEIEASVPGLQRAGAEVLIEKLQGSKDERVIEAVKRIRADLLVIGASRGGHLFHWVGTPLGKSIIRDCRIPILLCQSRG